MKLYILLLFVGIVASYRSDDVFVHGTTFNFTDTYLVDTRVNVHNNTIMLYRLSCHIVATNDDNDTFSVNIPYLNNYEDQHGSFDVDTNMDIPLYYATYISVYARKPTYMYLLVSLFYKRLGDSSNYADDIDIKLVDSDLMSSYGTSSANKNDNIFDHVWEFID